MTILLKFTNKRWTLLLTACVLTAALQAQTLTSQNRGVDKISLPQNDAPLNKQMSADTVKEDFQAYKVDGIAAVIGDYVILDSDIRKVRMDLENRLSESDNITDCQLLANLMESKLLSHAALQDSTVYSKVTGGQVKSIVNRKIERLLRLHFRDMQELLKFYRKSSEQELRQDMATIIRSNQLSQAMQSHITENIEITPEEVRDFFESIPEDERPKFGDEVEIARLTIEPKIPQSQIKEVVDKLNAMRDDILHNGSSFAAKAVLYSQGATSVNGGKMLISPNDPLDQNFKQIAFSLREGEISMPFESEFGYHIVKVDKIIGQKRQVRNIILIPQPTPATLEAAQQKIDSIRNLIVTGEMSFHEAAKQFSDDEETKAEGGQLINPANGDTRFDLTKIDPRKYNEINNLDEGEVSQVLTEKTPTGEKYFKLITVTGKYPAHIADFSKDYVKIKNLALEKKKFKAIQEWKKEEIKKTYVKISDDYKACPFEVNWLKN